MRVTPDGERDAGTKGHALLGGRPRIRVLLRTVALGLAVFLPGCLDGQQGGVGAEAAVDGERVAERLASIRALPIGEAYREALGELDPLVQHVLLADVYTRVDAEDFGEFRAVFEEDLAARTASQAAVFGNLWAKIDREDALTEVLALRQARVRKLAGDEVMSVWVQEGNADAARAALRSAAEDQPEGVVRAAEQSFAEALGRHGDLVSLLGLLADTEDDEHRRRMLAAALIEITRADRDGFVRWAERIHVDDDVDPQLKAEIVLQAIRLLATTRSVAEATDWYPTIADGPYAGEALSIIAEQWGRTDPVAAFDYLGGRPDSERPEMARRAVAFVWLQTSPAEARPWLLGAIDERPGMEPVVFPLVQYMLVSDPPAAMELAQRILDPREREIVLKQGLVRWARRDYEGASRYLERHEVPPAVREAVRRAKNLKTSQRGKDDGPR